MIAKQVRVALCFELAQRYHREVLAGVLEHLREAPHLTPVRLAGMPVLKVAQMPFVAADARLGYLHPETLRVEDGCPCPPTVTVANAAAAGQLSVVCSDDRAVGRLAAEYLLRLGLRKLACVGIWPGYAAQRAEGFREAVAESGLSCSVFQPSRPNRRMDNLIRLESELGPFIRGLERPCGLYCIDDLTALTVYNLAKEQGRQVPEDLAILGTNNDELLIELLNCPLSSIELDARQIGRQAARLLDAHLTGDRPFPARIEVPPVRVIPRASTDLVYYSDPVVRRILLRISGEPARDWTVDHLTEGLGVSRRSAEIRFRKQYGCGIYEHLIDVRIQLTKAWLKDSSRSIADIAEELGFCDQRQLTVHFRRRTGQTPGAFRKGAQR